MLNNYLWHIPARFGLLGEVIVLGNFLNLPTIVTEQKDSWLSLQLPDLTREPKLVIEHHFIYNASHALWDWPDSTAGWYPISDKRSRYLRGWLQTRNVKFPSNVQFRTRQLAIAPVLSMHEVINEIVHMLEAATALAVPFETSKEYIAHVLRANN